MQLQYLKAINRLVVVWVEQKKKNTDIYILIQNHDFIFLKTLQCIFSILLWLYKNLFSTSFTRHTCPQIQFSIM